MPDCVPDDFRATVLSPPGSGWAQVRLAGDVDMAAATELAAVLDGLATAAVSTVFVDVADITFANSTLPNFCVLLRAVLPTGAALAVCRPAPMTRWILQETGMARILTVRDDLPLLDVSRTPPPSHQHRRHGRPDRQEGSGSAS